MGARVWICARPRCANEETCAKASAAVCSTPSRARRLPCAVAPDRPAFPHRAGLHFANRTPLPPPPLDNALLVANNWPRFASKLCGLPLSTLPPPATALAAVDIVPVVARQLGLTPAAVGAALTLLDEGATVPFVARYRKERTGGLDEVQLRAIAEAAELARELDKRKRAVWQSLCEHGHATDRLRAQLLAAATRAEVEDLYLPLRPKRKTRASVARDRGLQALAERILSQSRQGNPTHEAAAFVGPEVSDAQAALAGACDIVAEQLSETPTIRRAVRALAQDHAAITSLAVPKHVDATGQFAGYADYREPMGRVVAHRYLAVCRGEAEGALRVRLDLDAAKASATMLAQAGLQPASPWAGHLRAAADDGFARLLWPSLQTELRADLKHWADRQAVEVFARNLTQLLMAPPFGGRPVIGIDPGFRSGCKCAVLDGTGALRAHATVFPHTGGAAAVRAAADLVALVRRHQPHALAVGNGTAGRETETFARAALSDAGLTEVQVVAVSEAGASVYSASEVARQEFPDLDLTVRGAVSIGRRLQDPLAELVQVEPKAIGVGQYQHDVEAKLLQAKLDEVVQSCVNQVGVELNTASLSLLTYVAGMGPALAKKVVAHRAQNGPFANRAALLRVSGLGPKAYEQAAGFLRVAASNQPLDRSAVHPERYALVAHMAAELGLTVAQLLTQPAALAKLAVHRYVNAEVGLPTLTDILAELARPGRDPRAQFEAVQFRDDIRSIGDVRPGMVLTGVVTNVAAFGAFVDLGVHQDGLVHVSQLADEFVRDPHAVVAVGQRITVRVLDVDVGRKRISLSARSA